MSRFVKIGVSGITFTGAIASIIALWSKWGFYTLLFIIVPVVVSLIAYFWEIITKSLKKRKARLEKLMAAQKKIEESERELAHTRLQMQEVEEEFRQEQARVDEIIREKAEAEALLEALREEEVQFYQGYSNESSGLDSKEAIEIIKKTDTDIYVTHFISNEPSSNLVEVISQLEKDNTFHRMIYFQDDENLKTENERRKRYSWLIDRINHERTENKFILEQSLPLDLLIVDISTVMIELPNIVSKEPNNLLVIRKKGVPKAFKDTFLKIFYDNDRAYKLTTEKLEQYFSTGKITP
ncbi:hypothetical protein KAR91_64415 [Candidatus Pacearchaeota archaeon]|nr:hypothetical protein [Candidatus Pacearchaeota archaeon]